MEACFTTLQANTHFVKLGKGGGIDNGFWGEKIRGGGSLVNSKRVLKKSNFLKSEYGNGRTIKGNGGIGVVSSVLTSDHVTKETMTHQVPVFEKKIVDPKSVASIILGGGAGTRLFPLTMQRAKPAVPIGGNYRLIDVPMSNCINSGINKIFVLTQFNSASLNRHLARTYNLGNGVNFGDGFVEVLAATQTPGETGMKWFQGTADAVRQFTWVFE
ncbi:hypothetical protein MKW92_026898, partial [Papaver armeniacum]